MRIAKPAESLDEIPALDLKSLYKQSDREKDQITCQVRTINFEPFGLESIIKNEKWLDYFNKLNTMS